MSSNPRRPTVLHEVRLVVPAVAFLDFSATAGHGTQPYLVAQRGLSTRRAMSPTRIDRVTVERAITSLPRNDRAVVETLHTVTKSGLTPSAPAPKAIVTVAWPWFAMQLGDKERAVSSVSTTVSSDGLSRKEQTCLANPTLTDFGRKSIRLVSAGNGRPESEQVDTDNSRSANGDSLRTVSRGPLRTVQSLTVSGVCIDATTENACDQIISSSALTPTTCETPLEKGAVRKVFLVCSAKSTRDPSCLTANTTSPSHFIAPDSRTGRSPRDSAFLSVASSSACVETEGHALNERTAYRLTTAPQLSSLPGAVRVTRRAARTSTPNLRRQFDGRLMNRKGIVIDVSQTENRTYRLAETVRTLRRNHLRIATRDGVIDQDEQSIDLALIHLADELDQKADDERAAIALIRTGRTKRTRGIVVDLFPSIGPEAA